CLLIYQLKRQKNNRAAQKCRALKKQKELIQNMRFQAQEQEIARLKSENARLCSLINFLYSNYRQ
ncbi:MAG: hypothetical protein MHMPM18_003177, partial [Marteilia pararefringens]